ncbi:MAG: twin-arginine translocase TatA/TatE family subunit [Spirochaetota bacterium]
MMGTTEIIIVVGVVLILFGARAIPKFARSVGKAKHEFEKGVREGEDELTNTDTNSGSTTNTTGTSDRNTDKNSGDRSSGSPSQ